MAIILIVLFLICSLTSTNIEQWLLIIKEILNKYKYNKTNLNNVFFITKKGIQSVACFLNLLFKSNYVSIIWVFRPPDES